MFHLIVCLVALATAVAMPEPLEFEGRTPCGRIANGFTRFPTVGCEKIKWELTLYRNPDTREPLGYRYRGTRSEHRGNWSIRRGMPGNPDATVYRLDYDHGPALHLLSLDDDVLVLLDSNLRVLVGDASWSYVLNRIRTAP